MSGLVDNAKQSSREIIRIKTRRNAHVTLAETAGKRVRGHIQPAARPVVSQLAGYLDAKITLSRLRKRLAQESRIRLWSLADGFDQLHLFAAQYSKDGLHFACFQAWLKIVQEWVVNMAVRSKKAGVFLP